MLEADCWKQLHRARQRILCQPEFEPDVREAVRYVARSRAKPWRSSSRMCPDAQHPLPDGRGSARITPLAAPLFVAPPSSARSEAPRSDRCAWPGGREDSWRPGLRQPGREAQRRRPADRWRTHAPANSRRLFQRPSPMTATGQESGLSPHSSCENIQPITGFTPSTAK